MELPPRFESNRRTAVNASLRNSLVAWWHRNQVVASWIILVAPLAITMVYGTVFNLLLPYLIISSITVFAAYSHLSQHNLATE